MDQGSLKREFGQLDEVEGKTLPLPEIAAVVPESEIPQGNPGNLNPIEDIDEIRRLAGVSPCETD